MNAQTHLAAVPAWTDGEVLSDVRPTPPNGRVLGFEDQKPVTRLDAESISAFGSKLEARGLAANTRRAYTSDLTQLLNWYSIDGLAIEHLDHCSAEWLNAHRAEWSPSALKRRKAAIRKFAAWCEGVQVTHVSVLADFKTPKPAEPVPHPLPGGMDDITKLYEAADTDAKRVLVSLCGYMGLRASEALSLSLDDFDLISGRVKIRGKGGVERWVPIPSQVAELIGEIVIDSSHRGDVLSDPFIGVTYRTALRWIVSLGEKAGLPRHIATHCLRMTAGTHLYRKTKDLRATQKFLGHADPRTTAGYTDVDWSTIKEGLEL